MKRENSMLKKWFPSTAYINMPNTITLLAIVAGVTGTYLFLTGQYKTR